MAIDRLKKVTLLAPRSTRDALVERLHSLSLVHITDARGRYPDLPSPADPAEARERLESDIKKLRLITEVLGPFYERPKRFMETFTPLPMEVEPSEVDEALRSFDVEGVYLQCREIQEGLRKAERKATEARDELASLQPFLSAGLEPSEITKPRRVVFTFGSVSTERWDALGPHAAEILSWQTMLRREKTSLVLVAYLRSDAEEAEGILREVGFSPIPLPRLELSVKQRAAELEGEIRDAEREKETFISKARELSPKFRPAQIVLAHMEDELNKLLVQTRFIETKRICVVEGFVREADARKFSRALESEFPGVSIIYSDPGPQDDVPVSITLPAFFRPAQLLVNMFGLPNYFTFDPTPFITLTFLTFFGLCFGDVLYGLMLIAFSWYMMRRYSTFDSLREFFALFLYAGIFTVVIGALTGAWAGDIYKYLGEDNPVLRLRNALMIIDPLDKPIAMLLFVIGLGVLNQFYGIILRMYREIRLGNYLNAIFDGAFWLILLPGFIIVIAPMFVQVPPGLLRAGKVMAIVGAAGLVLTQGRHEKSLFAKAITGVISLYGILGTYGCTGFIGDVLSYSRLLALGLTTTIVGMAFNIIASLAGAIPAAGPVFFALIFAVGHTMNFAVSILGAFVHPARLIFLEHFNRYYEGGAAKFQPFGFSSERIQIVEKAALAS